MRRAGVPIEAHFDGLGDRPTFADVVPLARLVTDDFLSGDAAASTSSTATSSRR